MVVELKNTLEWCSQFKINFDKDIVDPDGWNRERLADSLLEPITIGEFKSRIMSSTVRDWNKLKLAFEKTSIQLQDACTNCDGDLTDKCYSCENNIVLLQKKKIEKLEMQIKVHDDARIPRDKLWDFISLEWFNIKKENLKLEKVIKDQTDEINDLKVILSKVTVYCRKNNIDIEKVIK